MPTFSHLAIRRRMRLSAIRCSRKRIVHEWAMASKNRDMSASRIQLILRALIPYASASSASCWPRPGRKVGAPDFHRTTYAGATKSGGAVSRWRLLALTGNGAGCLGGGTAANLDGWSQRPHAKHVKVRSNRDAGTSLQQPHFRANFDPPSCARAVLSLREQVLVSCSRRHDVFARPGSSAPD
jgi:hypothetical protein